MQTKLTQRLLHEFIFNRVKEILRIDELARLETEIAADLAKTMGDSDVAREDCAAIVRKHMNRAWTRAESEWTRLRCDTTANLRVFDYDCPSCVARSRPILPVEPIVESAAEH